MAKRRPPYRDGKVHILTEQCSTCVFRPGNLMHLQTGRLADLVKQNLDKDTALICHQTLDIERALCRGFWDAYRDRVTPLQLAERLSAVTEVPPPEKP